MPDPVYALVIDGRPWLNWKRVSLSRSIERMGGAFSAQMTGSSAAPLPARALHPGMQVRFEIDGAPVLDGYIDTCAHEYDAGAAAILIAGRDKTGDLIDCAAAVDGPFEFYGQALEQVVARILKPFGIPLRVDADTGAPFQRVAIQPGETAHAFIERICRYRAILAVSDGIGGLALVKPAAEKSGGRLVYGQNILSGRVQLSALERFSLYVVKGQAEAVDGSSARDIASNEGRAQDDLVRRYRPTVITAESQGNSQTLQQRAQSERDIARARANTATYVVQGWYADPVAGALWKPNTVVPVEDAARGIGREMLITSISLDRADTGTTATLELAVPEAFNLPAEVEPKDSGAGAGWQEYDLMGMN